MRHSLEGSISELKKILDIAKEEGTFLNEDYCKRELQNKINLASMDIIFNYSRRFRNSQKDFEDSFDVIKSSIELLMGSTLPKSQIGRANDIVNLAAKQKNPKLKIPYRCIEYLSGYINLE
ncbi:MAG: hypothetical protein AABW83_02255 [Nanoarchaeota archaeon]